LKFLCGTGVRQICCVLRVIDWLMEAVYQIIAWFSLLGKE